MSRDSLSGRGMGGVSIACTSLCPMLPILSILPIRPTRPILSSLRMWSSHTPSPRIPDRRRHTFTQDSPSHESPSTHTAQTHRTLSTCLGSHASHIAQSAQSQMSERLSCVIHGVISPRHMGTCTMAIGLIGIATSFGLRCTVYCVNQTYGRIEPYTDHY